MVTAFGDISFRKKAARWNFALLAVSICIGFLAAIVVLGWQFDAVWAAQNLPSLTRLSYNSALGFFALGIAGWALAKDKPLVVTLAGITVLALGAVTASEYFDLPGFEFDSLFLARVAQAGIDTSSRMAFAAALSLALAGGALCVLAHRGSYAISGVLASLVVSLALTSVIADLFQVPYQVPYTYWSSMALYPALAFLGFGVALLGFIWTRADMATEGFPTWLSGSSASIGPIAFFIVAAGLPQRTRDAPMLAGIVALTVVVILIYLIQRLFISRVSMKGLILVGLPSMLLVSVAASMVVVDERRTVDEQEVQHAAAVIDTLQHISFNVVGAESTVRRYLITRDVQALDAYPGFVVSTEDSSKELKRLVAIDSNQAQLSKRISSLIEARLLSLSATLEIVKRGDESEILAWIRQPHLATRDELIDALTQFSEIQHQVAAERLVALQRSTQQMTQLLVSGLAGAMLLLALLTTAFSGSFTRRMQTVRGNTQRFLSGTDLLPRLSGTDEIAELDHDFHAMTESLQHAHARENNLNAQALARTFELERFRIAMDASAEAIFLTDRTTTRFVEVNATAEKMLGYSRAELLSMGPTDLIDGHSNDTAVFDAMIDSNPVATGVEMRLRHKDGHTLEVDLQRQTVLVDDVWIIVTVVRDITERRAAREQLYRLANYDALTNLPNRTLFLETLTRALKQALKNGQRVVVMCIDIDHFRVINETSGTVVADSLLQQFAARLIGCVRVRDTVGRLDGDELGVIQIMDAEPHGPLMVANNVLAAMREHFEFPGASLSVTSSIGIAVFPDDTADPEMIMKYARTALVQAKLAGRDMYRFFTAQMNIAAQDRSSLEADLRKAVLAHEFLLYYQPKIRIADGAFAGVEALMRWDRPGHGWVSPAVFIPVLEDLGLIESVGAWAISAACQQAAAWQRGGIDDVSIAVNVAGRQFIGDDLVAIVLAALRESGISPSLLELEITEGSLMANTPHTVEILESVRKLGIKVSIDDFGTGYSSLAYLRRFPIDRLKIDIAFVREITTNPEDAAIARAIILMAHSLKLDVVAEGVETKEQLDYLAEHGCDYFQGYYCSRPLPGRELMQLLLTNTAHA